MSATARWLGAGKWLFVCLCMHVDMCYTLVITAGELSDCGHVFCHLLTGCVSAPVQTHFCKQFGLTCVFPTITVDGLCI